MAGGLVASYGTFAAMAGRYLYPAKPPKKRWMFVTDAGSVKKGDAVRYRIPGGEAVTIARRTEAGTVDDFIALSSICPHLGCRVYWDGGRNKFICPCHDGHFDAEGKPIAGPPADQGTPLTSYKVVEEGNLILLDLVVTS